MKPRNVIFWILLIVLVALAMSAGIQAQELREVSASEILEKIQAGEDVYLENVHITGEFDLSKIELETVPVARDAWQIENLDLEEELKIIESEIVIRSSVFENNTDFSNTQFKKPVDFLGTSFLDISDFRGVCFGGDANLWGAIFGGYADFRCVNFGSGANFWSASFGSGANFWSASFGGVADFQHVYFDGNADFQHVYFDGNADFQHVYFDGIADFQHVHFNDTANFGDADFIGTADFQHVDFDDTADFRDADFIGTADFQDADFDDTADFRDADFIGTADFQDADFIGTADFKYMDFRRDIVFDNHVYLKLIKDFRDDVLFDDADNIYYQYRKQKSQASREISTSYLVDRFMWLSCGYGVRPWYAVVWAIAISFMCAIIYWSMKGIRQSKESYEDYEQDTPFHGNFYIIMAAVTTFSFTYLSRDCGWKIHAPIILVVVLILIYIRRQYKLRFSCWRNRTHITYKQGRKFLLTLHFRGLKKTNLWRCGVYQLENDIGKKGASTCDAFYVIMIAVTTAGFTYLSRDCGWNLQDTRILAGTIILICILIYIWQYRLESAIDKKDVSFCDAFYFSVTSFTTLSYGDWYPKNYYRILAAIEGFVGWLTLALFLVTLANVMIRP